MWSAIPANNDVCVRVSVMYHILDQIIAHFAREGGLLSQNLEPSLECRDVMSIIT